MLSASWMNRAIMSSVRDILCLIFPLRYALYFFHLFFLSVFHFMHVVTLGCDECLRLRLVQLLVALLIHLTYLGQFMPMVWTESHGSVLWGVTLMSWVISSLKEHELCVFLSLPFAHSSSHSLGSS